MSSFELAGKGAPDFRRPGQPLHRQPGVSRTNAWRGSLIKAGVWQRQKSHDAEAAALAETICDGRKLDLDPHRRRHDALVFVLARKVALEFPGELQYVNRAMLSPRPITSWHRQEAMLTDFDIEARRFVLEVKSGERDPGSMRRQAQTQTEITDKPVVIFAPRFDAAEIAELNHSGLAAFSDLGQLLAYLRHLPDISSRRTRPY